MSLAKWAAKEGSALSKKALDLIRKNPDTVTATGAGLLGAHLISKKKKDK